MISGSGVNSSVAMAGSMATSSITDSLWQVEGGVVVGAGGLRERGGGLDVKWDWSRVQNQSEGMCVRGPPVEIDKMLHCDTLIIQE